MNHKKNLQSKQQYRKLSSRRQRLKRKNQQTVNQLPTLQPTLFRIDNLLHDGRGVGVYSDKNPEHPTNKQGKKVFVGFALPGETVKVKVTNVRKSFEEGDCIEVIANSHPQRQAPLCQHFAKCGGCSLQHWQEDGQIRFKQSVLSNNLEHQAGVGTDTETLTWLAPLIADQTGYRTKARIGVRHFLSNKSTKTILGFRERASNRLIDIHECPILDVRIASQLDNLRQLLQSLDKSEAISHIEVAAGEFMPKLIDGAYPVAMIIRHLKPLSNKDLKLLTKFFDERQWQLYLQGQKDVRSIHRLNAIEQKNSVQKVDGQVTSSNRLYYQLPEFDLTYAFFVTDFTQVNLSVNRKMVSLACELLDLQVGESVLDLFSGLGNFSLAMAKIVGGKDGKQGNVIGVEGSSSMTQRAKENAALNHLKNTQFYTHDLTQDLSKSDWATGHLSVDDSNNRHENDKRAKGFDALLIDPPRSGAWEIMQYIPKFNAKRIVYVSCNPATLARDSKALIDQGYRMTHAGVMDMFCHTGHVESIAKFERIR